jgi:hypothetical protein
MNKIGFAYPLTKRHEEKKSGLLIEKSATFEVRIHNNGNITIYPINRESAINSNKKDYRAVFSDLPDHYEI